MTYPHFFSFVTEVFQILFEEYLKHFYTKIQTLLHNRNHQDFRMLKIEYLVY